MKEPYKEQLDQLAQELVTPERFGEVALAKVIELQLPETARVYEFKEKAE